VPLRFASTINRLRATLRGKHDAALLTALRREIDHIAVAALAADNSGRYIAANGLAATLTGYTCDELLTMAVMDLTPVPQGPTGLALWQDFIARGVQRGEYELRRRNGGGIRVRYWAYASVAPGVHVSLLVSLE
jgi:PAS domain S-box-containing protein